MVSKRQSDLDRLRENVRKRRAAVTAKERRILKNTGIDIKDTKADPRRPPSVVNTYSRPELNKYLAELNNFMARDNGYIVAANDTVVSKRAFAEYKRLEKQANKLAMDHFKSIKNIKFSATGMKIVDSDKLFRPDDIRAQGDIVVRPLSVINRKVENINGERGLAKLIDSMNKKLKAAYLPNQIKAGRKAMNSMMATIGDPDMIRDAKGLTNHQFDILWNYTNFATAASSSYHFIQRTNADAGERWYDSVIESNFDDLKSYIAEAKKLPTKAPDKTSAVNMIVNMKRRAKDGDKVAVNWLSAHGYDKS